MQHEEQSDILSTTAHSVVEGELVDEGIAEAIRRMRTRGMAKKAIARELGLDIKTVRKWLATEWKPQRRRREEPAVAMAHFPFVKTLESFEFKFQPSIDAKVVRELATCRFIANAENVLLLGPPGVGKTHLAVALGVKACGAGYRTLFVSAASLLTMLTRAQNENRLEEKLKALTQPKLLVVDEIGYCRSTAPARTCSQLIARRYERGSIIITSNQSLTGWGEVFGDAIIATAILDRLLHHSTTLNIKGESYRLKEKRKAGLLGRTPALTTVTTAEEE